MRIALGSSRAAKVAAVHSAATRIASIDAPWGDAAIIAFDVETDTPVMPLTDEDLMSCTISARPLIRSLRPSTYGRTASAPARFPEAARKP
jgi:hypothetical protein